MDANEPRGIHRRLKFDVTDSLRKRFATGARPGKPDECWPWFGAVRNGYGAIKHQRKVLSTHVVAYVIAKGDVPEGRIVTHDCDNKLCCNPAHLVAGTPLSNVREMHSRLKVRYARGESSPNAILTEEEAKTILSAMVLSGAGARKLSQSMNIPFYQVRGVVERRTWTHIAIPTIAQAEHWLELEPA